ncbi:FYVE zinc finger [Teladorsagia circumcincta]|uniref:FYVE zinc finger n=1 Tax=Teladorsagia circumcincta TaxID=45464 RepID=A0A2G9UEL7_TELCI|nr:FYVE zinc finger [Teladorsagia circumcincta]
MCISLQVEKILCTGEVQITEEKDAFTMEAFRSNADGCKSCIADEDTYEGSITAEDDNPDYVGTGCEGAATEEEDGSQSRCTASFSLQNEMGNCSAEPCMSPVAHELRSKFQSADDLIHRLFVCISGVADQLQTNYSSEVRKVLKLTLQPTEVIPVYEINGQTASNPENEEETGIEAQEALPLPSFIGVRWVPDEDCEQCTACSAAFTVVRRRHHCRNCGRIFCHRCSRNSIRIPELGYDRRVSFPLKFTSWRTGASWDANLNYTIKSINQSVQRDDGYCAVLLAIT